MSDIRDIPGMWCDDITFCYEKCDRRDCPRNRCNIRDHNIPHSFFVEIPSDCLKNETKGEKKAMDNSVYVPYHRESVEKAKELVRGKKTDLAKYLTITKYVTLMFGYDYIKAIKVAKTRGVLPDIETTWRTHLGICQDISAMVVGMLRAVGIKANLCIGKAGSNISHAWVEAVINGKKYRYDHAGKASVYKTERMY